ncbi:hypothetical protein [Alteromonas sp. KUL49]|uniref:hypothetical protein n=1 Tax=Alteromonas sp. KUL49 TaxID=2480798 RepID=UPI00102EFB79|nr:hypothetical protein [Alteromonas sp. KUL49]TAP37336.1 hypothetical protein EYS00_16470 [Alteromonas sp. KUL49]GEA12962.1 hypothetical protein KUL49_33370 [Alteromonas sp. KUL49]
MKSFRIAIAATAMTLVSISVCAVPTVEVSQENYRTTAAETYKKQRSNSVTLNVVESRSQQSRLIHQTSNKQPVSLIVPTRYSQSSEQNRT